MNVTYGKLPEHANNVRPPFRESGMPEGLFMAVGRHLGILVCFAFRGEFGSADAVLVGRIELSGSRMNHYIGGRMKGGAWVGSNMFRQKLNALAEQEVDHDA